MTFSNEKCNLAKSSLVFSHTDFVLIAVWRLKYNLLTQWYLSQWVNVIFRQRYAFLKIDIWIYRHGPHDWINVISTCGGLWRVMFEIKALLNIKLSYLNHTLTIYCYYLCKWHDPKENKSDVEFRRYSVSFKTFWSNLVQYAKHVCARFTGAQNLSSVQIHEI